MGRRKIEIQPITHERNRSVTFLKRKNGLFKKAYELGVLCSVDIAVIVFEERPGHHPKLYQYCSTDIKELVQRHIRHQGEKDTKGPTDFANSTSSNKFDDDDGDDDEVDDEEEYTPNRATKRRKVKKSRGGNADNDFEGQGAMAIPQPPIPSSLPVSSDRHAFREGTDDPNAVTSYPPGFAGPGGFRPGYPAFFPGAPGAGPGFLPPGGPWDGRSDFGRQRPGYDGPGNNPPYPLPPGVIAGQGGPGNLFTFIEEQQRRAQAAGGGGSGGIEWPDGGQAGQSQPPGSQVNTGSGSADWLDIFSPRNNSASGAATPTSKGNTATSAASASGGGERSTSAATESWERGGSSLPPKLRGGAGKEGGEKQKESPKEDTANTNKKNVNGKSSKKDG